MFSKYWWHTEGLLSTVGNSELPALRVGVNDQSHLTLHSNNCINGRGMNCRPSTLK